MKHFISSQIVFPEGKSKLETLAKEIYTEIVTGTIETVKTLMKKRENSMRLLILVDIGLYVCHSFAIVDTALTYLYMVK